MLTEKQKFRRVLLNKVDEMSGDIREMREKQENEILHCRTAHVEMDGTIETMQSDIRGLKEDRSAIRDQLYKIDRKLTAWSIAISVAVAILGWLGIGETIKLIIMRPPLIP